MRRSRLIALVASAVALASACPVSDALASDALAARNAPSTPAGFTASWVQPALPGPPLTVTSPQPDQVVPVGQPTIAGTAGTTVGDSAVTVRVYAGSATGTPLQKLTATPGPGGGYSVKPAVPLADGRYTAQAEQHDLLGVRSFAEVSFFVETALPTVKLDSPAGSLLFTATPTLSGTAGTRPGDSSAVALLVYPGDDTSRAPVRLDTGTVAAGGQFSIMIEPSLSDGQYTAVAVQQGAAGSGVSAPQTFQINANGPAVTLDQPAAGASTTDMWLIFSGAAGNKAVDSPKVQLSLYSGASASGQPIGTLSTTRSGAQWSTLWPTRLPPGVYTAQASQSDDLGDTGISSPHSFRIVRSPKLIGSMVRLSRRGLVSLRIGCAAAADLTCTGTVLILTQHRFQPVAGGPVGQLRMLFAYVSIPGGRSALVTRRASTAVTRLLRHRLRVKVKVTTSLTVPGFSPGAVTAIRRLKLSS